MYMAALLLLRVHLVTFRHTDMDLFFFFFFFFGGGGGGDGGDGESKPVFHIFQNCQSL